MTRSQKSERKRAANVLAAFALALTDKVSGSIRDAAGRSDMASAALIQIGFEPGMSIERLRLAVGLSHSAMVRVIDQLQADGLVKRERDPAGDSRVALLSLTRSGEAQMRDALAARERVTEPAVEKLSLQECQTLLNLLQKALPALIKTEVEQEIACRFCDLGACPQDTCPIGTCGNDPS